MREKSIADAIFNIIGRARRPLSFDEIASAASMGPKLLKRPLKELLDSGKIIRTRRGVYLAVDAALDALVTGYLDAHADGYGFIVSEKPGVRDIFVPPHATLSAMDGDRVVARIEDRGRRQGRIQGRIQGKIIRIVERVHKRIPGTIVSERTGLYLRPKNKSIPPVSIPQKERGGAKDGQNAVIEITEFPGGRMPLSGRVVKIIERPEEPRADVEAIIEEFSLPRKFSLAASEEAKLLRTKEMGRRKDLTSLNTVTIDGEKAKDFDDAVSISLEEHGYRLGVHIADVGFYVDWDAPLDLEARKRATSVYFPDRVIPMLPKELSEDLCSLRPGVERPAFTVEMHFDRDGNRTGMTFYPSLIKSRERMTYTSVAKILDGDPHERKSYEHLLKEFDLMAELCGLLRRKRLGRGSLDFDLPEPEVLLDVQGRPEAVIRAERNLAHMIIEEFMISANEAVAEYLQSLGVPSLYRIHEEPETESLTGALKFIKTPLKGKPGRIIASALDAVKGKPEEEAVTYSILRSLKQARYAPENVGHFGLASKCYTHFTSPIRRYPDLIVHRILREALLKKRLPDSRMEELERLLPDISFHSSRMERLSERAERESVNAMRAWFMKDKVGEEFEGMIMGVKPHGLRVRLDDFYVEGLLHVSYLTDDYYIYNERSMTLRGRSTGRTFRLGQRLRVRVDRVDLEEREIVFGPA